MAAGHVAMDLATSQEQLTARAYSLLHTGLLASSSPTEAESPCPLHTWIGVGPWH